MAQERPNRLAEWLHLARRQTPVLRDHFLDWVEAVREEPRLAWQTTAVRFSAYGVGGLLVIFAVTALIGSITPPPPASSRPAATSADFHVVCENQTCGHHFVIHRAFGFDAFPIPCPLCMKQTGVSARRCNSTTCGGRWVAPAARDDGHVCPHCGTILSP